MRSIKRRFDNISKANPYWSSYICFSAVIRGQKFSKQMIHRWFNKLVEKDDYDKRDKKALLAYLCWLAECPEGNQK